jgi:hypothetical protein
LSRRLPGVLYFLIKKSLEFFDYSRARAMIVPWYRREVLDFLNDGQA